MNSLSRILSIRLPLTCVVGLLFGTFGASMPLLAQNGTTAQSKTDGIAQRQVTIDAEDATLYSVLTTLMQSVGANYTLATELREVRVTAHLHGLRLETALDVLLRGATPAYTYQVTDGVYRFMIKTEPITPQEERSAPMDTRPQSGIHHLQVTKVNFIDAAEVARILGGIPIRTSNGQTYGLIDPTKFNGRVGETSGGTGGGNGSTGTGANGAQSGNAGAIGGTNGASGTLPVNLFDYLWIVNAGAE